MSGYQEFRRTYYSDDEPAPAVVAAIIWLTCVILLALGCLGCTNPTSPSCVATKPGIVPQGLTVLSAAESAKRFTPICPRP